MPSTDPRVDAYIARSAAFAQPILAHVRAVVHEACPDVVETIKWGMPTFEYHGLLASMSAFKAHAAFGFWKNELVTGAAPGTRKGMGSFGRLTSIKDLPSKRALVAFVKKGMRLNLEGTKAPRSVKRKTAAGAKVPEDLAAALKRNAAAQDVWKAFPASKRRDYIEWIVEAKRPETRAKRVQTSLEWIAQGKSRNWQYERAAPKKKSGA